MSETNQQTIAAYDAHIQGYVANTPSDISRTSKTWLDTSLDGLTPDARILEIGSGFGHDAAYIEQLGFTVERSDVTPGFVKLLQEQGHDARRLNVLTDEIEGPYDLVFADAVLHHLTRPETETAAQNVLGALSVGGRFAASLRIGHPEGWSDEKLGVPRYFSHWERDGIVDTIKGVGFASIVATDAHKVGPSWLHFIASKS
ncbi:MAG TPA: methyltransferase [Patescibacteria group bacterium]|nr:methyltransferase [Patescibacteria group bacterium]